MTLLVTRLNTLCSLGLLFVLTACGGGGSVSPTTNPNLTTPTASVYSGPAAASADVQAFQTSLWSNLRATGGCGNCHVQAQQSPSFVRTDDINLAYQAANTVVDLTNPSNSLMVAKVAGGHHCWLASNSACADQITAWITLWASATHTAAPAVIKLQAPPIHSAGGSRQFPVSSSTFATTIYPIVSQYCVRCHASTAAVPQSPFFADPNVGVAYLAAQPKIDLNTPANARLVVRLRDEFHNCWDNCANNAASMLTAVQNLAGSIAPTALPTRWVTSKALTLYEGTVAGGAGRYEGSLIAKYEFKTGTGLVAYDTSGVEPSVDLNFSGNVNWVGGWGVTIGAGGKLQGTSQASAKLYNQITASGEYTIEAWAAPANVAQTDAVLVGYSAGPSAHNFEMTQSMYNYNFLAQSSKTNAMGSPALSTATAAMVAQATLQHIVMTYDAINGRQIYVNGNLVASGDAQKGGDFSAWDNTFALVLGNEISNNHTFNGTLRLVAIYNRALTPAQVQLNYNAGVGEKYFLLFNVSDQVGVPDAYVVFTVSQYDSYAYLFENPSFLVLNATAATTAPTFTLKGMRLGLNGQEAAVGQAYSTLNLTLSGAGALSGFGLPISNIGTIVPISQGPGSDLFFLTFEQLGSATNVRVPVSYTALPPPVVPAPADIGIKNYARINATMATLTGVDPTTPAVANLYSSLQQSLPPTDSFTEFAASHQVAISQLAIEYCDALVSDSVAGPAFFPGVNFAADPSVGLANSANTVISPLLQRVLGSNLNSAPMQSSVSAELSTLITKLSACSPNCPAGRTAVVVKAVCAAVLGSAATAVE